MKEEKDIFKESIIDGFDQKVEAIDFTELVMQKVDQSIKTKTVFAPLIPKSFWKYLISGGIFIVLVSFIIEVPESNLNWFDRLPIELPNLSNYKTTIKLFFTMTGILLLLTLADLVYRKNKVI